MLHFIFNSMQLQFTTWEKKFQSEYLVTVFGYYLN